MDAKHAQHPEDTASDDKRVFKCGECNRAYSRADHLARHVRSHTQEKPYRCQICSKGFARGDLLKRHAAAHQRRYEESQQYGEAGHERISRVSRACKGCSEMHLRCDDAKPCARCQRRNIHCVTVESGLDSNVVISSHTSATSTAIGTQSTHVAAAKDLQRLSDHQTHPGYGQHRFEATVALPYHSLSPTHPTMAIPTLLRSDGHQAHFDRDEIPVLTSGDGMLGTLDGWFPFASQDPFGHRSLLNFGGVEPAYNFSDMDMTFLNNYNFEIPFDVQMMTPEDLPTDPLLSENIMHTARLGHDAYRRTGVWRWRPNIKDTSIIRQQDLNLPSDAARRRIAPLGGRKLDEKMDSLTRDKIVALVVAHCTNNSWAQLAPWNKRVSSFPSVELLDALIQFCLTAPLAECDLLFHLPTLSIRKARPELVMALVAFGATLTPDVSLNKLGMSLQEVLRQSLPSCWERNNELTRDLELAQAYHLVLVIGFWSGDGRKMELSEAFLNPAITMQRRANRFRRHHYQFPAIDPDDEGEILERKWRDWLELESWKRLVHHTAIGDAMHSLAFLVSPAIAFSELVLPLPDPQDVWQAPTALAWKNVYLSKLALDSTRRPSMHDCLVDTSNIMRYAALLNDRFLVMGVIGNVWRRIWDYRQEASLFRNRGMPTASHLNKADELRELVRQIRFGEDLSKPTNVIALLFLEITSMHMYLSLDDVQLFAGMEGPEEARSVYPELVDWSHTSSSREAIWHAGQVLRIAKACPKATLHAICAIAVYQASIAFWTYGLMLRDATHFIHDADASETRYIWLDEPETIDKENFIHHNSGLPVIRGLHNPSDPSSPPIAGLNQPVHVMDVIIHIFRSNWDVVGLVTPVLVENLINLLAGLRVAAENAVS